MPKSRGRIPSLPPEKAELVLERFARIGLQADASVNEVFGAIRSIRAEPGPVSDVCELFGQATAKGARTALFAIQDILLQKIAEKSWPDAKAREAGTVDLWPADLRILRAWLDNQMAGGAKPASLRMWLSTLRSLERLREAVAEAKQFDGNRAPNAIFDRSLDRAIKAHAKRGGDKAEQAWPIRIADLRRIRERILDEDLPAAEQEWADDLVDRESEIQDSLAERTAAIILENRQRRALGIPTQPLPKPDLSHLLPPEPVRLLRRAALLGLGFFGKLRPAEAVALRVGDFYRVRVEETDSFRTFCVIRRSKRDQTGAVQPEFQVDQLTADILFRFWERVGIEAALPAGAALDDAAADGTPYALPLLRSFRAGPGQRIEELTVERYAPMSVDRVSKEVKAACDGDPDLGDRLAEISGYSLRVGAAVTLAESEDKDGRAISLDEMMDQLRHATPAVSMRYLKQANRRGTMRRFFEEELR
jgi:integrase